jgi:Mg2+ and Co2+ transporter CorA
VEVEKEIKLIGRRTEETLAIIVDHFKDTDERIEELEDKIQEMVDNNAHVKNLLIKQVMFDGK